jgi:SAM-dependent methyltransferase
MTTFDYQPHTYGEHIAERYDDITGANEEVHGGTWAQETTAGVDFLAKHAASGPVLELGIGTGRVAIPLADRGFDVHGIDISEKMLRQLHDKATGRPITTSCGDFSHVAVSRSDFSLVFCVYSTFFALLDQESQVACFRNVAGRLRPGGRFVIETLVPTPGQYNQAGQLVDILDKLTSDEVRLRAARHDPVQQRLFEQHIEIRDGTVRLYPVRLRYAWPAELDLMAQLADLRPEHRYGGWHTEPFTANSFRHVSVYTRQST